MSRPPSELPIDARLDALWREASQEEPPAALDDAIRAAARQAVRAGPRPLASGPFGGRWRVPLSVAAVVVVSATVTVLVVERERDVLRSSHEVVTAPASGALERDRKELAPGSQFSERLGAAPAASPAAREPQAAQVPQAAPEERKRLAPAALPPGVRAEPGAAPTHATEPESPGPDEKAGAAEGDAERRQRTEVPQAAAGAAAPMQAAPRSDTLLHDAPAPASAMPVEPAKREMVAPAKAKQAGDEAASMAAKQQARTQENAQGRQPEPRAFPAAPPVEEAVADAQSLEAKAWLERILELRRQGRLEEAEKSLKAFRDRYPAYPLPPELKTSP